jgi:tetrahydromethanopterin S-methyltransferase subunit E
MGALLASIAFHFCSQFGLINTSIIFGYLIFLLGCFVSFFFERIMKNVLVRGKSANAFGLVHYFSDAMDFVF